MKLITRHSSLVTTFLACGLWALGFGPSTSSAQVALKVTPTTGAIVDPVTAATFAAANSLLTTSGGAAAYQPLDADLTSIAALTTTSFGRGLLDDADASAGRVTLGLGTAATYNTADLPVSTAQAAALAAKLSIAVFANDAARAAAVPAYIQQIGIQGDTGQLYTAFGTSAGNWDQAYAVPHGAVLRDSVGEPNIDLTNRQIIDADGNPVLTWGPGWSYGAVQFPAGLQGTGGAFYISDLGEASFPSLTVNGHLIEISGIFAANGDFATAGTFYTDGDFSTVAEFHTGGEFNTGGEFLTLGDTTVGPAGSFSATGVATTTFTVTIGTTMGNTTYKVSHPCGLNALSSAPCYVTNQTTTTFDVVFLTGLTGAVAFTWQVTP